MGKMEVFNVENERNDSEYGKQNINAEPLMLKHGVQKNGAKSCRDSSLCCGEQVITKDGS